MPFRILDDAHVDLDVAACWYVELGASGRKNSGANENRADLCRITSTPNETASKSVARFFLEGRTACLGVEAV